MGYTLEQAHRMTDESSFRELQQQLLPLNLGPFMPPPGRRDSRSHLGPQIRLPFADEPYPGRPAGEATSDEPQRTLADHQVKKITKSELPDSAKGILFAIILISAAILIPVISVAPPFAALAYSCLGIVAINTKNS